MFRHIVLRRSPLSLPFRRFKSTSEQILSQYKAKLNLKAKELGVQNIDELKIKLKDELEEKKKTFNQMDPLKELEEYEKRQSAEFENAKSKVIKVRSPIDKEAPKVPYKTMSSYVDVDKMRELPRKEIEFLWKARFISKDRNLHAVVQDVQFANIYANAFKNPSFILPLPKNNEGYEMHFVQWSFVGPHTTHCMLTTVAEYKLHKEYAKPHTTLMFHQELRDQGVVLMNGQVETESALSMDEALLLVMNVQRFYGDIGNPENSRRKYELLKAFTVGDDLFDMDELIKEATTFE
jgi:ATP synthase F1 complex assembly factor 1